MTADRSARRLIVEADGGSRGNPGAAGYGAVVLDAETGELLAEVAEAIGRATNNVAEYRGLLAGLRTAIAIDPACTLEVRMDSKLVVEQMSGRWQIKHHDMRALAAQARGVLPTGRVSYTWIPRAENTRADALANQAMDAAAAGRSWSRGASVSSSASSSAAASWRSESTSSGSASSESTAAGSAAASSGSESTSSGSESTSLSASTRPAPTRPASTRPDSIRPDPTRADPTRPDSIRPDSTRPDSIRPESTRPDSTRAPVDRADLGAPTVLLLLRHGRTLLTEQRRFSGRGGLDPELSEAGLGDAHRAAELLAALGLPGAALAEIGSPTAVVSSPLRRTRQTADAVAARLGLPVTVMDDWAEIAFGEWDGLTFEQAVERWPAEVALWQGSMTARPPGGESLEQLAARVCAVRAATVAAFEHQVVVVATHGVPVRAAVHEALEAGPPALWRTRIDPASITAVRYWSDGGIEVSAVNVIAP